MQWYCSWFQPSCIERSAGWAETTAHWWCWMKGQKRGWLKLAGLQRPLRFACQTFTLSKLLHYCFLDQSLPPFHALQLCEIKQLFNCQLSKSKNKRKVDIASPQTSPLITERGAKLTFLKQEFLQSLAADDKYGYVKGKNKRNKGINTLTINDQKVRAKETFAETFMCWRQRGRTSTKHSRKSN